MPSPPIPPSTRRPTGDVLVIFLAAILAVLVLTIVGLVIYSASISNDGLPVGLIESLATAASTLTAAIVGYVAGRGRQG